MRCIDIQMFYAGEEEENESCVKRQQNWVSVSKIRGNDFSRVEVARLHNHPDMLEERMNERRLDNKFILQPQALPGGV